MKQRTRKYEEGSPVEFLLLREQLGMGRYRKRSKRDEEKRKILMELGLKKIEEKEKDDFIPVGYRRRKVKIVSPVNAAANQRPPRILSSSSDSNKDLE